MEEGGVVLEVLLERRKFGKFSILPSGTLHSNFFQKTLIFAFEANSVMRVLCPAKMNFFPCFNFQLIVCMEARVE